MATVDNQQSWLPYDGSNKGCSQGFCSIYCPQWCYVLFPPPPPISLTGADDESSTALSPLVIAIISILATALLLVSYYIFVSKYCASLSFHRTPHFQLEESAPTAFASGGPPEECHVSQSSGLEVALINTVWKYKRQEGLVEGTDCSVCLSEFKEEESLRLLPKCGHAFHLQCIDTWLKSHPNCPLCRDNVMSATPTTLEPESRTATAITEEREQEMVVIIEDGGRSDGGGGEGEHRTDILEIEEEEDAESILTPHEGRVSIADVLQLSMEEEYMVAKDRGLVEGSGSWRPGRRQQGRGGGRIRGLHCILSPVRMKRYDFTARSVFARQERGRTSPLPV